MITKNKNSSVFFLLIFLLFINSSLCTVPCTRNGVVFIGPSGSYKTTIANMVINNDGSQLRQPYTTCNIEESDCTQNINWYPSSHGDTHVFIIDFPGFSSEWDVDTLFNQYKETKDYVMVKPVHAYITVTTFPVDQIIALLRKLEIKSISFIFPNKDMTGETQATIKEKFENEFKILDMHNFKICNEEVYNANCENSELLNRINADNLQIKAPICDTFNYPNVKPAIRNFFFEIYDIYDNVLPNSLISLLKDFPDDYCNGNFKCELTYFLGTTCIPALILVCVIDIFISRIYFYRDIILELEE